MKILETIAIAVLKFAGGVLMATALIILGVKIFEALT